MTKTFQRKAYKLRVLWILHVKLGRFSFFIGLGEVRRT